MSGREDYINNLQVGDLIAFSLSELEAKMYSGKISKIGTTNVEVQTKNGRKYFVDKSNIRWVNTTGKWPMHIFKALKGIVIADENIESIEIPLEQNKCIFEDSRASEPVIIEDSSGVIVDIVEND